jgi:uncharacterized protein (DUF362 family)
MKMFNQRTAVVYLQAEKKYPSTAPFHPHESYPDYIFNETAAEDNLAYESVRQCFNLAGLDQQNYGTADWNPLRGLVCPGETVLLKPNLVKENHPRDADGWVYVLTHGSVIRAVADYVWKALEGRGKIMVADAPQTDSSFTKIKIKLGLDALQQFYWSKGLDFEIIDLRKEEWHSKGGVIVGKKALAGDPNGYVVYDLGAQSEFWNHKGAGYYYGADYDAGEVNRHHANGHHEYLIAGSAIKADVIFSLPKLKTHKKAGITVALKNLVGINGDKNWLPHHTEASAVFPGDERPHINNKYQWEKNIVRFFRELSMRSGWLGSLCHWLARKIGIKVFGDTNEIIRSGNWWGNDTAWRMCLDLNKIIMYGKMDSSFRDAKPENRKKYYVLVDGIIAGEGKGPMDPDPVGAGLVVFGLNPATTDAVCARLMGFDPELIPIVRQAFCCRMPLTEWGWEEIRVISNKPAWNKMLPEITDAATFHFAPHFGWIGHIEKH